MTITSRIEKNKFGRILFQIVRIRRAKTEKSIEVRKDEKNEEKKMCKEKCQGGISLVL